MPILGVLNSELFLIKAPRVLARATCIAKYHLDLIEAYDAFINSNLKHEVFNIGGGPENTLSLLELLDLLDKLTGKRPSLSFKEWRPGDQKVYISNTSKAQKNLGWTPTVSPKLGVKKLADWVSENKHLFNK